MRALRYRAPLLIVVAMVVIATAAWADIVLVDFSGFDWFWPAAAGQPGSCYGAVGYVPAVNPTYLTFNYGANEYTFNWDLACYVSADTFGTYVLMTYDGSTSSFNVYGDPIATGTTAQYGTNPPNAVSPSTWKDGEHILGGDWDGDITIVVDTSTGQGDVSAMLTFNTGTQLANIPPSQRTMALTLAGLLFNPPNGPSGYHWQIDGQVFIQEAVPVEESTWGALKKNFGR